MKIRWNHINRGLVLGLVLAAGTAVYVIAQNAAFKKNIPEITDKANEICKEIAEANVGDNREGVQRKLTACIQDNFISKDSKMTLEDTNLDSKNKSSMLLMVENMGLDTTGKDRIYSAEYEQISSSVTKWGIDGANVQIDYKITLDCDGSPDIIVPDSILYTYIEIRHDADKDLRKTIRYSGSLNMYLFPDGDTWKAVTVSYNDDSRVEIEYPEDAEGGEG
ncbi:hypothetical protein [Ruminococcus albus]|uniref:Uncharacterized protein n=1 Tax=Ruminococcus albus TaxID=1264 RepID=A0A1H7IAM7_RUMAL|nr:hypothetical protein [Ruminococcus albus]SEK59404.1 hypothetical protein SAMN05216469_103302 [Ruminococcus albus]